MYAIQYIVIVCSGFFVLPHQNKNILSLGLFVFVSPNNHDKDNFGKGNRLYTVISTIIMAHLVTSRGLEFASQLWLLSLIDG